MMRSLYSGVAGLKAHQTKMDIIGNNIANVNTVAFKSTSVTFSELMYQTTASASGANALTGTGGINAKQIGLGVTMGATTVNITTAGATQTTGNPFDIKIKGDSFFVVSNGTSNYFTKAGAFYVDGSGNLAMTSTGYNVMGWQVDETTGNIKQDTVSALKIMQAKNLTSNPEATTLATCSGVLDRADSNVTSDSGKTLSLNFYDALGYSYTAKFAVKATKTKGEYTVELKDVINSENKSIKDYYNVAELGDLVKFGNDTVESKTSLYNLATGVSMQMVGGVPVYSKGTTYTGCLSNYDLTKISGYAYVEATPGALNGASTSAANGTASFTKDVLQSEPYSLIYNSANNSYFDTKSGTTLNSASTAADWNTVFGYSGATVTAATLNTNGTLDVTISQTFDVDTANNAKYNALSGTYEIKVSQADAYGLDTTNPNVAYGFAVHPVTGAAQVTTTTTTKGNILKFNTDTGIFESIGGSGKTVDLDFAGTATSRTGDVLKLQNFSDVTIDFSTTKWFDNEGTSTLGIDAGDTDKKGAGKVLGALSGVSIDTSGKIYGTYDNGNTKLLGQIAVASFANASGLEKVGDNLYNTTLNSGAFDGIGQDVTSNGGSMSTGVLEMSNVDLSSEFTEMITTQRGFQANSRIITTSDTLLEELINLKR